MTQERTLAETYAAGLRALEQGVDFNRPILDLSPLLPLSVSTARRTSEQMNQAETSSPAFHALTPEEHFAVGLICKIIRKPEITSCYQTDHPRLMIEIMELRQAAEKLSGKPCSKGKGRLTKRLNKLIRLMRFRRMTEEERRRRARSNSRIFEKATQAAARIVSGFQEEGAPSEDAPKTEQPGVLIHRLARRTGAGWSSTRSWVGGRPKLGGEPWPLDESGRPLVFMAQLDLAEIADRCGASVLPNEGALAFFIGFPLKGVVTHIPPDRSEAFTELPAGGPKPRYEALDITTPAGETIRWPVGFARLPLPPPDKQSDAERKQWKEGLQSRFTRGGDFSAYDVLSGPPVPH